MTRICAFDLSLTHTGWGVYQNSEVTFGTILPPDKMRDLPRLNHIRNEVLKLSEESEFILMEGLSFGSNDPSAQERAGLAYLIRMSYWKRGLPFCLIAPGSLKKWSTGKGSAPKEIIIREVFKRWAHNVSDDHQADALAMLYLGMAFCGEYEPTMKAQRDVMKTVMQSNQWLSKFRKET